MVGLDGGADDSSGPGGKKRKKRVQLSLHVARANEGLGAEGVKEGAALPACVRSVEDHGYLLTFGIKVGATWRVHMTWVSRGAVGGLPTLE